MLIVGERINTTRKRIRKAVADRDAAFIKKEARKQADAGATYIDVNAGTSVADEVDDLQWLVQTVQSEVDLPLCVDSANPEAQAEALKLHQGRPLINSVSAEEGRIERFLPLITEYDALVVALTMGAGGVPTSKQERMDNAAAIIDQLTAADVPVTSIYWDPALSAVSADQKAALDVADTVSDLMATYEGSHTICGLSNISFGLPQRNLLNRTYLAILLARGLDGVIMDPTEKHMMSTLLAARVLMGQDDFCMDYIMAEREGRLVSYENHKPVRSA
jgi:5-methyltetrahydrofolate--homocysteine methyltransferase